MNSRRNFFAGCSAGALAVATGNSLASEATYKYDLLDFVPEYIKNDILSGDPKMDHYDFVQKFFDQVKDRSRVVFDCGIINLSKTLKINNKYLVMDFCGTLRPTDKFNSKYLIDFHQPKSQPYFRYPVAIRGLTIDCRHICRGVRFYFLDHLFASNIRVENFIGRGIYVDRVRESLIEFPVLTNGIKNLYSDRRLWGSDTIYGVGDIVLSPGIEWNDEKDFFAGEPVYYNGLYFLCTKNNRSVPPNVYGDFWTQIPLEYYECIKNDCINKDPRWLNTNSKNKINRFWRKIYLDEAALEVSDVEVDGADRTNQVTIVSPIIRDCGNMCYLRIDSSKTSSPATHVNILHGHIHNTFSAQKDVSGLGVSDMQRMIEIGYGVNININGTNIRVTDSSCGICIMIGDSGYTKKAQNIRINDSVLSGFSNHQRGIIVMPSGAAYGGDSKMNSDFIFTKKSSRELVDINGFFVNENNVGFNFKSLSSGRAIIAYKAEYSSGGQENKFISYSVNKDGEIFSISSIGGDVNFNWRGISKLKISGDGVYLNKSDIRLSGVYDAGRLWVGELCIWSDSEGSLRVKKGAPTHDNDGSKIFFDKT